MKRSLLFLTALATLAPAAVGAEQAYTVRPTELKAKPFSDAATLASLAEKSTVDVLLRQTSWMQVKSDKTTGWVKMLSLRFDGLSATPGKGVEANIFNINAKNFANSIGGSTPTTGVKGIAEEALKNPHPNPTALKQMMDLEVSPNDIQGFARSGKLSGKTMDYVPAPRPAVAPGATSTPAAGAKK